MSITRLWPDTVYRRTVPGFANPPFAQVLVVDRKATGKAIYVSGTFACDVHQNLVGEGDMGVQVSIALENVRLSLAAAGAAVDNIVRVKMYVTDMGLFMSDGLVPYNEFFQNAPTSSTVVEVSGLTVPGGLVEIEAEAEL
jgi:enamine deaminase RidA (YjgF/YER057c/UK114 family)